MVQIRHQEASAQAATTDRMPLAYDAGDAFGAKLRGRKIGRTMPLSIPRNTRHGVEGSVPPAPELFRCAIYTHKSTEHNFDLEFNSLDAQRETCEADIKSQAREGCRAISDRYDDGDRSGARKHV